MGENLFRLVRGEKAVPFILEAEAYEGVKRIAKKVAEDVCKVTGMEPELVECGGENSVGEAQIVIMTLGKSILADSLFERGKLQVGNLHTEREVYSYQFIGDTLYIIGSDKRGTIYGLFHLSELIGVSPLCYFGDAAIVRDENAAITKETIFSKQPSVLYRGFFINDEWPAFGNWATDTFGDVNAKAYDTIFELLLRMKGNYLWPAMWNSSFSQDGPGIASAELADLYGVVMGTSHHEPLCRAGVEWQRQYRNYGTDSTWNFLANREAISAFWEDGVERNKDFENVITIGMRGESDSKLLPEDATMADNVAVLQEAILAQHAILRKKMDKPLSEVPRMLAIYKEVEQYYYGDHTCQGLKDWKELEDVIFLLSDDNHGNLRALPTEEERKHPGGFGMYYHVDYHGGPISYEWINSTKISKIWEQMTTAYEYGIRSMWIVNVGDLKGAEYPLSFFMDLAYDYETYGLQGRDHILTYPREWVRKQLGKNVSDQQLDEVTEVLNGFVEFNAVRRPEYTHANVYHPTHYGEGQWVIQETKRLIDLAEHLHKELPKESVNAYESCIYYPALASLHLHCMNALAGYNHWLAERGSMVANPVGEEALLHLHAMEKAVNDFHMCIDGKWNHMMQSAHTGFRSWDDYNWTYPTIHHVEPIPYPKAMVGFRDHDRYHLGAHWQAGEPDLGKQLLRDPFDTVILDIESRGSVDFTYKIACDSEALVFSKREGKVCARENGGDSVEVALRLDGLSSHDDSEEAKKLCDGMIADIYVDISFEDSSQTQMHVQLALPDVRGEGLPFVSVVPMLSDETEYAVLNAADYLENYQVDGAGFEVIPERGRFADAVKCFPTNRDFSPEIKAELAVGSSMTTQEILAKYPHLIYEFEVEKQGTYEVTFELVPANPDHFGGRFAFFYSIGQGIIEEGFGVASDYNTEYACQEWDFGVVNHIRKVKETVTLEEGRNTLTIFPGQPGFMLERITIIQAGKEYLPSYLGPQ